MTFSRRSGLPDEINSISAAVQRARAAGELLDLTVSNPTHVGLPYAASLLAPLADPGGLDHAPEPFGLRSAREAVAQLYRARGMHVDAERVGLTASTSEAYSHLFKLLCDPGDEVLAPRPSYPLFEQLAALDGVELRHYRLAYDGAWHVDLDSLRRAVTARTKAVLVVSPNNPTGSSLSAAELDAVAALGLPIISDEVFSAYPLAPDAQPAPCALERAKTLTFCLGGLSKLIGLPQLKVGWWALAGDAALVDGALRRLELIADTYLSVAAPVQLALPRLLAEGSAVRKAILARIRRNLGALRAGLAGSAASVLHVQGGWSATLRLPATRSEDDWVTSLLDERVLVQPGWFYDVESGPHVVVSLITPPEVLDEGVARLVRRLG